MSEASRNLEDFKSPFVNPEDETRVKKTVNDCINRIMGTLSFRKLAGKTQVILSINGPDVRTRLTHTMEVAKISRDLCQDLRLNSDLAEAIALAHDIGHTPFGHVGERTLTDIMCGCNTLDGKLIDTDFGNAGFKHNLQSFRVLMKDLGHVDDGVWPYVYWGALTHTNMSYAKRDAGELDNDIFISTSLCKRIYNCHFHSSRECKRNALNPQLREERLCKPWFCAILVDDEGKLPMGKRKYLSCEARCYMAQLWKAKIDRRDMFTDLRFLFDHPFPNIYYADFLYTYFLEKHNGNGWVSLEAFIVSQADEIAQRRQDLEDAVNTYLLKLENAKQAVKELIKPFYEEPELESICKGIDECNTPHELGEKVVNHYKKILIDSTGTSFYDFTEDTGKISINIYSLLDIIYRKFVNDPSERREWIYREIKALNDNNNQHKPGFKTNTYFEWNDISQNRREIYLIAIELLELGAKLCMPIGKETGNAPSYEYDNELLGLCIDTINKDIDYFKLSNSDCETIEKDRIEDKISFLRSLDKAHRCIRIRPKPVPAKLKLFHYFVLDKIHKHLKQKNAYNTTTITEVAELLSNFPDLISDYKAARSHFFHDWKATFGVEAYRILYDLVGFVDNDEDRNKKKDGQERALKAFKESQENTIIKSEKVEKNDGKANYILGRLFKAYLTNPHQLPDSAMGWILKGLKEKYSLLLKNEIATLTAILNSHRSSLFMSERDKETLIADIIKKITSNEVVNTSDRRLSNEIKALLKDEAKLRGYLQTINADTDIEDKECQKRLRRELDNPVLGAIPMWKSVLVRGICDHIAGLTDLEAISEYEKLYTGVMELV